VVTVARPRFASVRAVIAAGAVAAFVAAPLTTAAPANAGITCGLPLSLEDCTAPDTVITASPSAITQSTAARFEFTTGAAESGATFECKLEGASQAHDWSNCTTQAAPGATTSTGGKLYTGLSVGLYTFHVRATDKPFLGLGAGNTDATPASYAWRVDEVDDNTPGGPDGDGPQTTITTKVKRWHLFPYIGVKYTSDESALAYRCALDGKVRDCGNGQANIFGLGPGEHVFTVAAVDEAGNVDPTPASIKWTNPYDDPALVYSKKQWKQKSGRGNFQDTYTITTKKGATAQMGKKGFVSAVLVATKSPTAGQVDVFFKGKLVKHINLHKATTTKRKLIKLKTFAKPQQGLWKIVVTSAGKDVIIDGIGFSRRA
jgi:hypothetical protein